jgi:hypothetical protein
VTKELIFHHVQNAGRQPWDMINIEIEGSRRLHCKIYSLNTSEYYLRRGRREEGGGRRERVNWQIPTLERWR